MGIGDLPEPIDRGGFANIFRDVEVPTQHADHVAIHHGRPSTEANRCDGCRRVAADTRQRSKPFNRVGELSAVLVHNRRSSLVQIPGTAVVAQAGPDFQDIVDPSSRQDMHCRESSEEPLVVRQDRGHLRLLEHDFAKPNSVRVFGASPGKVATTPVVPRQQAAMKRLLTFLYWRGFHGGRDSSHPNPLTMGSAVQGAKIAPGRFVAEVPRPGPTIPVERPMAEPPV